MVVFPLKWLPYLLVIGGLYGVISGEEVGFGIVALVVGGIWLFLKHSNGSSSSRSSSSSSTSGPSSPSNNTAVTKAESKAICPNPECHHSNPPEALYCEHCGTKLR